MHHWTRPEISLLSGLRERFLSGTAGARDYWRTEEDLALYDRSLGERIGWKWDAVVGELTERGWHPRSRTLLDWGCGSGIASRRVLAQWPGQWDTVHLFDRSALAARFAAQRLPGQRVETRELTALPPGTLVVLSHVINEVGSRDHATLLRLLEQADEVIWVEAGTHADSRSLIAVREALRDRFTLVAPCPHQLVCGLLAPENSSHWCHNFAAPPNAIFQDASWMEFGKEMGIDLRSVPYSFLTLTREAPAEDQTGLARVLGRPRPYKGFSKVLSCEPAVVRERMLQKRDAPALLRALQETAAPPIRRWVLAGDGKITGETARPSPGESDHRSGPGHEGGSTPDTPPSAASGESA